MVSMFPSMPSTQAADRHPPDSRFQEEAALRVAELRGHLEELVACVPAPARTASEFQRQTGLDMKLCWKVYRVLKAPDHLSAARYVPGTANMRTLLGAMSALGAPAPLVERVGAASERFERFVGEHAGDRRTFDSMVSGYAEADDGKKIDLRQRQAAFRANSHVWGVQADAMVMTMVQRASASDPMTLDEVGLRAEYGVRRLRPSPVPLYEQTFAARDKRGHEYSVGHRRPLCGGHDGVGLIPEFCSRPLPEVIVRPGPDGRSNAVVMHTELGMKGAVDLVMGFELCGISPRYRGDETHCWAIAQVAKPFRVIVIDLLIEEGTLPVPPAPFGFMATRNTAMVAAEELWTTSRLTESEPVRRLGRGTEVLATGELPRYDELVRWALERSGCDPRRFEAWRLRVEYPVVLSSVGLAYEMPYAPGT